MSGTRQRQILVARLIDCLASAPEAKRSALAEALEHYMHANPRLRPRLLPVARDLFDAIADGSEALWSFDD